VALPSLGLGFRGCVLHDRPRPEVFATRIPATDTSPKSMNLWG